MEVKILNNILEIFLMSTKTPFHTLGPFVIVVGIFKFRESSLAITNIENVFRYI